MELIEVILSKENLNRAYKKVVANKGASGVDGVTVEELGDYIRKNREKIVTSLRNRTYIPKPVRRVYIPKDNGKKRPLGIPTALDRTIQQAIAQPMSDIYEEIFSDYSYGFRPGRSCHDAIKQALEYLNGGYEWVVDIDIEQFFDRVNHDKLIQILREQVNDSTTLNLIRKYLKAGVMENGLEKATITGVPQGGPLSVVCSNIYLDKLVKRVNEIVRGWINYFRIGMMKQFMGEFGKWLRHKIRVIVMKQWKKPKAIYRKLSYLNWKNRNGFSQEDIYKVANSRLGWYRRSGMNAVNFIISKDLLENRIKDGAGLLNPLSYYLVKVGI